MGTTLTGTTPQDTYDSLIKVTDNGPLSGSLKTLTDGLGNDSALALSTGAASITGSLSLSSGLIFSATDFVIGANTSDGADNKASYLCGGASQSTARGANIRVYGNEYTDQQGDLIMYSGNVANSEIQLRAQSSSSLISMFTNDAERVRITSAGNVGIGTSAPTTKLTVDGVIRMFDGSLTGTGGVELSSEAGFGFAAQAGKYKLRNANNTTTYISVDSDGLKFNNDTAAANALDDYEEGTFSPTVIGTTTAGTATYVEQNGRYTKIGRLVQFEIYMTYSGGTGTGNLRIANLPFTIGGSAYASFSIGAFDNVTMTASNIPMAFGLVGSASIFLGEMPTGGGVVSAVAYDGAAGIQIAGTYSV